MKYNPFRPNSTVSPGMFVGRLSEVEAIEQALLQTKNENPQHFLVHGERGIGKTSLFDYIRFVATGEISVPDGVKFKYLTVSVDLGQCQNNLDVVRKLARGFKDELGRNEELKEMAKGVWEWVTNWEILGIKYNRSDATVDVDVDVVIDEFVTEINNFINRTSDTIDGILFIVDEADWPPVEAGLGKTLKFVTERLARLNCRKVLFGLAGLPSLLSKLRESHESSPRLFETMLLEPLSDEERKSIVKIGLEEANEKNDASTEIDKNALQYLADLSEGYPHFVQQFAYSAFDFDDDNLIGISDVANGAFRENGALSQLGDKFFSEMYHARISSEDYRRVLDSMAEHGDQWISRKDIISESGVSDSSVNNALKALKDKEIIIQDDARRGYYRLPTQSFATWINAISVARSQAASSDDQGPM